MIHILQNGIPRSGNLWLQYLLRRCLAEAGIEVTQFISGHPVARVLAREDLGIKGIAEVDFLSIHPLGSFFTILDVFRWPVEDLDEYVSASSLVSSHTPWNEASKDIYRRFSHVVYIIRDPRDAAVSMARFAFTPFNRLHRPHAFESPAAYLDYHFKGLMQAWVQHVSGHLFQRQEVNIHFVFFERLLSVPETELKALADFLGLSLCEEELQRVLQAARFPDIKQEQPHHLVKGQWGQWCETLNAFQIRQADGIAGSLLEALGYPHDLNGAREWHCLPALQEGSSG